MSISDSNGFIFGNFKLSREFYCLITFTCMFLSSCDNSASLSIEMLRLPIGDYTLLNGDIYCSENEIVLFCPNGLVLDLDFDCLGCLD